MKKHAYLILAHADPDHLQKLVEALDDERNDIYIHIDKKSDLCLFKYLKTTKAKLSIIGNRIEVYWGTPSQIYAEIELFKSSLSGDYSRLHLISGVDFPIKSQDEVHAFFDSHSDEEFLDFSDETQDIRQELYKKCNLYHYFLEKCFPTKTLSQKFYNFLRHGLMAIQIGIKVNRKYSFSKLYKGSNWVSITPEFAKAIVDNEETIKKEFRLTHCCDEVYKQTLAKYFGFKISPLGNLRYIDFTRGTRQNPYTFQESDYEELISRPEFFVRKISTDKSKKLATNLAAYIASSK